LKDAKTIMRASGRVSWLAAPTAAKVEQRTHQPGHSPDVKHYHDSREYRRAEAAARKPPLPGREECRAVLEACDTPCPECGRPLRHVTGRIHGKAVADYVCEVCILIWTLEQLCREYGL
jgi:hypothetical protein